MIQVGGCKLSTVVDSEIPKKYGLRQTIAYTMGIGGIMRALRTIPVLVNICHDARPAHEGWLPAYH
jgi:alpha-galactosidase